MIDIINFSSKNKMFSRRILRFYGGFNNLKSPWEVLNLKPNSSEREIKRAYIELVKQYHPDKTNGNDEKFKEVQNAFEILSDPLKRKEYFSSQSVNRKEK